MMGIKLILNIHQIIAAVVHFLLLKGSTLDLLADNMVLKTILSLKITKDIKKMSSAASVIGYWVVLHAFLSSDSFQNHFLQNLFQEYHQSVNLDPDQT